MHTADVDRLVGDVPECDVARHEGMDSAVIGINFGGDGQSPSVCVVNVNV